MKKPKRKKRASFRTSAGLVPVERRVGDIKSEKIITCLYQAEEEVLPLIRSWELSAGAAIFLLAQRTQALAIGGHHLEPKNATNLIRRIMELWKLGLYQPSSQYPFTLNETLLELTNSNKSQTDYSIYFQPFIPVNAAAPMGMGQIAGGIVQHPQTRLWQIWIVAGTKRSFLGAYRDSSLAQKKLEAVVNATRKTGIFDIPEPLYEELSTQIDGEPEQIPFDMMVYLIGHSHLYTIKL